MKINIRKNILCLSTICVLLMGMLNGCTYGFPEGFDKEAVITEAEEIIGVINEKDYAGLVALIRADLQGNVTAEEFEESWGEALDELGAFEKFGNPVLSGETDMNTGEDFALIAYRCYYENGKATYTIYFDADMQMTAVYMQLD